MNCLFIYNQSSGSHKISKKLPYIESKLKDIFDNVDIYKSNNGDDFINYIKKHGSNYDNLIFSGGDGTFNMTINALMSLDKKPIIGIIPSGTLNDASKNFGLTTNIKKSLSIIKRQNITSLPIIKANNNYFVFSASFGAYSHIPELTKNKTKMHLGKFAYYFKALPMAFHKETISGTIKSQDKVIPFKTNFIMVLNSKYMGGFKINKDYNRHDNQFDIVFSKCGIFNGLPNYFIFKRNITRLSFTHATVELNENGCWDLDGETSNLKNIKLSILPEKLQIICK